MKREKKNYNKAGLRTHKSFFLLVDIAHPVSALILDPKRDKLCGHKTALQAAMYTLYQVNSSSSTIPCHYCAGLWQAQHTYASYPEYTCFVLILGCAVDGSRKWSRGSSAREGRAMCATCDLLVLERIFTKVILDGLKRNMSRGNSLSDELELSSVLGDTRAYLYSPVWG